MLTFDRRGASVGHSRSNESGIGKAENDKSREYTWKAYGDGIVNVVQDAVRER